VTSSVLSVDWLTSFVDEIKTAASQGRLTVPKSRSGRRPMSVDTMLRKEKDGTLYKEAVTMVRHITKAMKHRHAAKHHTEHLIRHEGLHVVRHSHKNKEAEYQDVDPRNPTTKQTVRFAKGDVPSREDIPGKTSTEFRPMMAGTVPAGRNLAPEGFNS